MDESVETVEVYGDQAELRENRILDAIRRYGQSVVNSTLANNSPGGRGVRTADKNERAAIKALLKLVCDHSINDDDVESMIV